MRISAGFDETKEGQAFSANIPPSGRNSAQITARSIELEPLPSLLRIGTTWRLLGWWTLAYGISSWAVEYLVSQLDPQTSISIGFAFNRVVYAVVWSGAIVVAIITTERAPVTSPHQVGRLVMHLSICLIVSALWGVLAYYACLAVVPGWKPQGIAKMLATTSKNVLFGYGLVVVLVHIILRVRAHRNHEVHLLRQAHSAAQAQLQVLKLEMQPHFLFNALHAVSALIDSDPAAANDTLVLVSDMLRHAVETVRVQEVPLEEEMRMLRLYTQIQQVRFGDRLRVEWRIEDEVMNAAVPHMLLQPVVENAIKHGLEVRSEAGRILVSADRNGGMLRLVVRDDGPGLATPSPRRGAGVGMSNIRNRLSQLYPSRHSLAFCDAEGGGTEVRIEIPFKVCVVDASSTITPQARADRAPVRFDSLGARSVGGCPIEPRL